VNAATTSTSADQRNKEDVMLFSLLAGGDAIGRLGDWKIE